MEILNPAALKNLLEMVGGDTEFIAELVNVFFGEAPKMLSEMRQALESKDATLLHRAAHSLKSSSAEFGALALSDSCRELEKMGRDSVFSGADELLERAKAEYAQAKAALETMCQNL